MNSRETYTPAPAFGAEVKKAEGERWTLALVRNLKHPPARVWEALTDPTQLQAWAPFDSDGSLAQAGTTVNLTTVGAPSPHVTATTVTRADPAKRLEFNWGGHDLRWELEAVGTGTRLTLWTTIPKKFIAMGAAGWHICLDVMDRALGGAPVGRIVGLDAAKFEGWQRLHAEYARQFGIEMPKW